ncbi:MAG: ribonuclease D [Burkholderiales bacterium]
MPNNVQFQGDIAIDTEAMGLNYPRDRLCLVQLSDGQGDVHLVQFQNNYHAPNLSALLVNPSITKIFHFARFDVAILRCYLKVLAAPIYCTKIASKLARTYTDLHGLKELCRELIGVQISKQQQSSDWGAKELSKEQLDYAASDVLYLHALRDVLNNMLQREGRMELAEKCFAFLPWRAELDLAGWPELDIFAH